MSRDRDFRRGVRHRAWCELDRRAELEELSGVALNAGRLGQWEEP